MKIQLEKKYFNCCICFRGLSQIRRQITHLFTLSRVFYTDTFFCLQVVAYILERNACLLPAYFAVTEIRKLYPEGKLPHWVMIRYQIMYPGNLLHTALYFLKESLCENLKCTNSKVSVYSHK